MKAGCKSANDTSWREFEKGGTGLQGSLGKISVETGGNLWWLRAVVGSVVWM